MKSFNSSRLSLSHRSSIGSSAVSLINSSIVSLLGSSVTIASPSASALDCDARGVGEGVCRGVGGGVGRGVWDPGFWEEVVQKKPRGFFLAAAVAAPVVTAAAAVTVVGFGFTGGRTGAALGFGTLAGAEAVEGAEGAELSPRSSCGFRFADCLEAVAAAAAAATAAATDVDSREGRTGGYGSDSHGGIEKRRYSGRASIGTVSSGRTSSLIALTLCATTAGGYIVSGGHRTTR